MTTHEAPPSSADTSTPPVKEKTGTENQETRSKRELQRQSRLRLFSGHSRLKGQLGNVLWYLEGDPEELLSGDSLSELGRALSRFLGEAAVQQAGQPARSGDSQAPITFGGSTTPASPDSAKTVARLQEKSRKAFARKQLHGL